MVVDMSWSIGAVKFLHIDFGGDREMPARDARHGDGRQIFRQNARIDEVVDDAFPVEDFVACDGESRRFTH